MTPTDLPRLAGLLHHIPDARDLRLAGPDGTAQALPWQAVEVYAVVGELVETAAAQAADMTLAVQRMGEVHTVLDTIQAHAAKMMLDIRAALRLPPSTPWADVLARARSLAEADPARTLDGEVGDG